MMGVRSWVAPREAVVVFVKRPSADPEVSPGDDEPIIGVVASEEEAEEIAAAHSDRVIEWEVTPLFSPRQPLPASVLVAVECWAWEEDVDNNPGPLAVVTTIDEARTWAQQQARMSCSPWDARRPGRQIPIWARAVFRMEHMLYFRHHSVRTADIRLLEVPFGRIDISAPVWPRHSLGLPAEDS